MSRFTRWLDDRRQRRIEDEERRHRHWIEMSHGPGTHDVAAQLHAMTTTIASYHAAIVALQADNKRLWQRVYELEDALDTLSREAQDQ